MPAPRFYLPGTITSSVKLESHAVHHALNVLRLKSGNGVVVFNGEGGEHHGVVSDSGKNSVTVDIKEFRQVERESPLRIALAQGISSGDHMDFTVQKAIELGVESVQPLATQKSVVRLNDERAAKRAQHWQRVVISACEQCGRNRVPRIEPVLPFREWLARLTADEGELRWLLSPDGSQSLRDQAQPGRILLLAGPEGGFTPDEVKAAQSAGFVKLKVGPRTLRTETAALAALAAMQTLWGDV